MKKLFLIALLIAAASWYFLGGRKLSEANVREFYQMQEVATLKRLPEDLCDLLDDQFEATGAIVVGNQSQTDRFNKDQACENYRGMYRSFEELGAKMGGILQLDYRVTLHKIDLSPDRKSATVDVSYALDVGGSLMNIRSHATETLIRRNGKPLMLRSIGQAELDSGE